MVANALLLVSPKMKPERDPSSVHMHALPQGGAQLSHHSSPENPEGTAFRAEQRRVTIRNTLHNMEISYLVRIGRKAFKICFVTSTY